MFWQEPAPVGDRRQETAPTVSKVAKGLIYL